LEEEGKVIKKYKDPEMVEKYAKHVENAEKTRGKVKRVGFFTIRKLRKVVSTASSMLIDSSICPDINIVFFDEESIKKLNEKHRNADKPTDVLSFPNFDLKGRHLCEFIEQVDPATGLLPLGDIVICPPVARKQAKEYGHSFAREICFLGLHGFLHLLGFDHENEVDEKEMKELAESILEKCKIRRA